MEKSERNDLIVKDYKNGVYISELCEKYSLHRSTLQRILKKNKVKLHKNKSFIKCNKNFFSTYNEKSSYWAGFIMADGSIRHDRNSLQITLALKDKLHLYKFMSAIECIEIERVKIYKDKVSLTISIDEFKKDLLDNFNITPRKTYTAKISDKIPKKYLKDFLRGYMDGDGCVHLRSDNNILTVSFVGTVQLLTQITNHFKDTIQIKLKTKNPTPPISNIKNGVGSIIYSSKNAIKILEYLYGNYNDDLLLNRKFEIFNKSTRCN